MKSSLALSIVRSLQPLRPVERQELRALPTRAIRYKVGSRAGAARFADELQGIPETVPDSKVSLKTINYLYRLTSMKKGNWHLLHHSP